MTGLAAAVVPSVVGGIFQDRQSKKAAETSRAGAASQAAIEARNRAFQRKQFEEATERQQPFVDVGQLALPHLVSAVNNLNSVGNLPGARFQKTIVSDFLGENAPEFVKNRAFGEITALEGERQKQRLADLVNIGVGGTAGQAGAGVNLGSTLAQSLGTSGNIQAGALQDAAVHRANRQNQLIQGLAGLPALAAASGGFNTQASPLTPSVFSKPQLTPTGVPIGF
jgi:hypothetical protein